MSEPGFTPGPWEVRGEGYAAQVFSVGNGLVAAPTGNEETRPANARLIAAAPALYEALKRAEQFIENGIEYGYIRMPDPDTPDSAHKTLPAIEAALSLVLGETGRG